MQQTIRFLIYLRAFSSEQWLEHIDKFQVSCRRDVVISFEPDQELSGEFLCVGVEYLAQFNSSVTLQIAELNFF